MKKKEYIEPTIISVTIIQPMSCLMAGSVQDVNFIDGDTDLGINLGGSGEENDMWDNAY